MPLGHMSKNTSMYWGVSDKKLKAVNTYSTTVLTRLITLIHEQNSKTLHPVCTAWESKSKKHGQICIGVSFSRSRGPAVLAI